MRANQITLYSIVIVHFIILNIAFQLLAFYFEFPDVLRYKTINMFQLFLANQSIIQPTYYLFTLSGITFFIISFFIYESLEKRTTVGRLAMCFGCLAGLLTSFGFIRWVFVIPELANYAVNNENVASLGIIIESNIKLIHSYSGVALGENLAFLFQGLWLVLLAIDLHLHHSEDKKIVMPPFFIGLGIIIYSLEQFGGIFSGLGFINIPLQGAWLIWLLAFSWALINSTKRKKIYLTFKEGLGYSLGFVILMLLAH
ncbi:MAG: hypothetical protein GY781_06015 [Gammaproteobacteria bacterium]|nr:hypothetical protein [Gammaproteobacteria bacterium]